MATCKGCIHYIPCGNWAKDCFGDESLFPYECEESEILCEDYMPTADVVPRAEVARDIFAEIEPCHAIGDITGTDVYYAIRVEDYNRCKDKYIKKGGEEKD